MPQKAPQRPNPAQRPAPQKAIDVSKGFWIVLCATAVLFLAALITMTVLLIVDGSPEPAPSNPPTSQGDGGGGGGGPAVTPKPSAPSSKTGISLPSVTKDGSYSYASSAATDISTDSGIESRAAALIDVTNGRAVAAKNGNVKIYPASMTKVMTLLIACENAEDPTALLTVTEEMVTKYKSFVDPANGLGPSVALEWKAGYQVTVEDALYMIIYESDTYACWLLAEHVAGSEAAFVQKMNSRFSLSGTNFENCTGLYHDDHYTTCLDMAAIMAAAMNNEVAAKVLTSQSQYSADIYVNGTKQKSVPMWSGWYTGRLEAYPYGAAAPYYAGNGSDIKLIAGKTGYEVVPQNCFVTAGRNDETGTLFVCVQVGRLSKEDPTINPKTSTDDTREIYQRYATY